MANYEKQVEQEAVYPIISSKMKGDIGIEKQVEQEAAYPIPISLYIQLLQDSES